jgi:hypothetical protein
MHPVCNTRECANTLSHTSAFRSTSKYDLPSLLPAVAAVSSPPKYCRGSAREPFCAAASWRVALNGCSCSRWSLVAVVVAVVLLPSRLPPSAMCSAYLRAAMALSSTACTSASIPPAAAAAAAPLLLLASSTTANGSPAAVSTVAPTAEKFNWVNSEGRGPHCARSAGAERRRVLPLLEV